MLNTLDRCYDNFVRHRNGHNTNIDQVFLWNQWVIRNKYKQVAWLHQSERTTSSHFNHTEIDASMMLINMGFFSGLFINSRYSLTPGLGILIKMQTRLAGFRLITEGKLHDIFYHCFLWTKTLMHYWVRGSERNIVPKSTVHPSFAFYSIQTTLQSSFTPRWSSR